MVGNLRHAAHYGVALAGVLVQLFMGLAARAEEAVQWAALKRLDVLAEKCEALGDQKNVAGLRKIAPAVKAAAALVAKDAVPMNARQPDAVRVLQGDLRSLADAIADPEKQDGEELAAILAGIHPVVEKLMEAAGLPHVHEGDTKAKDAKQ